MSDQQIKWAASHDWFEAYVNEKLIVREESVGRDGRLEIKIIEFDGSFWDLRDWAGY